MSIKSQFIDSLEAKNIDELRKIPKADLHVHTWASGCRMFIFEKTNRWIEPVRHKLIGLSEISPWADSELGTDVFNAFHVDNSLHLYYISNIIIRK